MAVEHEPLVCLAQSFYLSVLNVAPVTQQR